MNHFKDKLKFAIMRESNNVKTSGVSPLTLLAGFYVSRCLPFNYNEMNDAVSFNRAWESLMPTATEMLKELSTFAVFGEMRALHYAKLFYEYRVFRSVNVWHNLWGVFGHELFKNGLDHEDLNGVLITEDNKMEVIGKVSDAFTKHRDVLLSSGYISSEMLAKTYAASLDENLSRSVRKYMMNEGTAIINKCVNIQMWSMGYNKRLTDGYRPFLKDMFDNVEPGCLVDESMFDFIIKHSVTKDTPVATVGLKLF